MKFTRKTILAIIAFLTVVAMFLQKQFGLSLDPVAVIGGLGVIVLYIRFEAKLDVKRIGEQVGRFKDPKFWIAFVTAILPAVQEAFGLNLPTEAIVTVLTIIMSILFKVDANKVNA